MALMEPNQPSQRPIRCWYALKAFILKHFGMRKDGGEAEAQSEIQIDLSDKNTFFAWQRNHMANERTFLAWCRTGISLIVFSFVIERFDLLIRELRSFSASPEKMLKYSARTHYMGLVTFALGAFIIVLAGWRFFYIRKHIDRGGTDFSAVPDIFLMSSVLVTIFMIFLLFVFLY